MNEYCVVVYYGKNGLRKELFRGTLSECREKRKKHCSRLGYVYDEEINSWKYTNVSNGNWMVKVGSCVYEVKIKKVKEDNSFYNTWDTTNEDNLAEKLWAHRYWNEIIEKFKN